MLDTRCTDWREIFRVGIEIDLGNSFSGIDLDFDPGAPIPLLLFLFSKHDL